MKGFLFPHPPLLANPVVGTPSDICKKTIEGMKMMAKECQDEKPDLIVYITSHGPVFNDAIMIHPGPELAGQLNRVDYRITIDELLSSKLQILAGKKGIPLYAITHEIIEEFQLSAKLDHGVMVPLSYMPSIQEVPSLYISYGFLAPEQLYEFGMTIAELVASENRRVVIVASGDLSHCTKLDGPYGFDQKGLDFDKSYLEAFRKQSIRDLLFISTEGAMECGKRCVDIMLGCFDKFTSTINVLSYEDPYGVGYGCVVIEGINHENSKLRQIIEDRNQRNQERKSKEGPIVKFVRSVIEKYLRGESFDVDVDKLPDLLKVFTKGSFVSIHDSNGLRGCMGNIGGIRTFLYEDIMHNAIKASTEDPRFHSMTLEELDRARITVDILSRPQSIESLVNHNPKTHGLIVENDETHGLLLPDLEGIDSAQEQLRVCLSKAGISPQTVYKMYEFSVERYF